MLSLTGDPLSPDQRHSGWALPGVPPTPRLPGTGWALPLLLGTSSLWVKSLALLYTVISLSLSVLTVVKYAEHKIDCFSRF